MTTRAGLRVLLLALGLLALLALACDHKTHHLAPYDEDRVQAAELERRAERACLAQRSDAGLESGPPPATFTTDGCSASPNGDWVSCCVEHDILYWCGGSEAMRERADGAFRACIAQGHGAGQARLMYWAVRAGGSAWWPFPWRWGYGWPYFHGYEDTEATRPAGE